jgi:multidrug efflux pump subunit AcrA (membrane-fusion protein)
MNRNLINLAADGLAADGLAADDLAADDAKTDVASPSPVTPASPAAGNPDLGRVHAELDAGPGQPQPDRDADDLIADPDAEPTDEFGFPLRDGGTPWWAGLRGIGLGVGLGVGATVAAIALMGGRPATPPATAPEAAPAVANADRPAQSVTVATVEPSQVVRSIEATGTVDGVEMIPVLSPATGLQIMQVLVREGQTVQRGQPLAVLNDSVLRSQLIEARGSLLEAQARLDELRAGTRAEEIEQAREAVRRAGSGVERAKADLDLAEQRVRRNEFLGEEGAIARDRLDEVKTQALSSQANLEQAEAELRDAVQELQLRQRGPRPQEIAQAEARLIQAQGRVRSIMAQLQEARVVAPVDGVVVARDAKVGDVTSGSDRLFEIVEQGRLELQLAVPENQLFEVRPGQPVRVTANAGSNKFVTGRVREIDPLIDPQSRQATVKVDLPAIQGVRPGMFLRGAIATAAGQGLAIPAPAVQPQTDGSAQVYRLRADDTVEAVTVQIGAPLPNDRVEVRSGLTAGDRVVVKGAAYIRAGDQVAVVSELP